MTQIIERVARAIEETVIYHDSAVGIDVPFFELMVDMFDDNDLKHMKADCPSEAINTVRTLIAQAALEEIKFEQLVGALKVLLGDFDPEVMGLLVGGVASCPECTVGTVPNDKNKGLCAWHKLQALISELEKTE